MVLVDINSFIVNFVAIIPTAVIAVKVERHYTQFWTAFWNMFALIATGISMILAPAGGYLPTVEITGNNVPIYFFLFGYAILAMFFGFKYEADILRQLGSSKITASLLILSLLAQYQKITNATSLLLIGIFSYVGLWILDKYLERYH